MISSRMPAALALFVLVLHAAAANARDARGHWLHPGADSAVHVSTNPKAVAREFGGWLDQIEQSGQISGMAVAIVKDDTVLLQRGIGYADASRGLKVQLDSPFRLASLSKAFASALTAMLVDEGMLSWNTRVAGVLPTFELKNIEASEKLTVRDILSQRVGLPHNTYDRLLEQDEPYEELVEKLRDVPMTCDVGDCYGYQNITFALIGDITYAVSGDFFYHEVEKRIFHPLGMNDATYGRDALEASRDWARPHARRGRAWVPIPIREAYYHVPAAAGVNASIKDMTAWLIAQMGGRPDVLPEKLLATVHTPLVETPSERHATPWRRARLDDAQYALGWRVYDYAGQTLIYHAGAVQGYRSMIAFFPKYRFGAVMLWNCECALPGGLMPMLLDRYLGLHEVDWAGLESLRPARHRVAAREKQLAAGP
ncbi:MAG: beta-lactamase family protein [Xanthomonadaceae bacterium]|nr:beta-lactamase family protein [Xanthomonadaceae bacterium]MDE2258361.1 beta-lactamase family protein [Xanthomonadaceae bacterium]